MPLTPICLVKNGGGPFVPTTNGVDVTAGATISIKLLDPSSVVEWYLQVIGTDELSTTPVLTGVNGLTHLVTTPNTVVTFTFPASIGRAVGFKSTVTGIGGPLEVTFGTYTLTAFTTRVGFVTETREGNPSFGWATKVNPLIRDGGGGGGGPDNFSLTDIAGSEEIPAGQVMLIPEAVTVEAVADLVINGELASTQTFENHSIAVIPQRATKSIQARETMLYTSLQVMGDLILDGNAVDISPDDANDIVAKLETVPAEVRAAIDVYSEAEVIALIGTPLIGYTNAADENTALGDGAATVPPSGGRNTAIGRRALEDLTTGFENTCVGTLAGRNRTTGENSVHVGYSAGSNSNGNLNVSVGSYSLVGAGGTPAGTVAIGYSALTSLNFGTGSIGIGYEALRNLSSPSGLGNIGIGYRAGRALTNPTQAHVAIGPDAMLTSTPAAGSPNVAIGEQAMENSGAANSSVAIGYQALRNATGTSNTGVGPLVLQSSTGSENTGVGLFACTGNAAGTRNTGIGYFALAQNTGGNDNTAIGHRALDVTEGSLNTAVGSGALGAFLTFFSGCTAVGYNALILNQVSNNTAIGTRALDANTTGLRNTAVGVDTIGTNVSGNDNTAIGHTALDLNTGSSNTAVGSSALGASSSSADSTAVGFNALLANTAAGSTAVGARALDANAGGTGNTAVGTDSLGANVSGNDSTAVGYNALLLNTGNNNTALGARALDANVGDINNTAIGVDALGASDGGANNTALGARAGSAITTGDNNVLIGYQVGDTLTTGTGNVLVGYDVDVAAGDSNQLNIGGAITGETTTGSGNGRITFRRTTTNTITALGTNEAGAEPLITDINRITVINAGVDDGVRLPAAAAGREIIVINAGGALLNVYANTGSGDSINGGASTTQADTITNRYVAWDDNNWVKL